MISVNDLSKQFKRPVVEVIRILHHYGIVGKTENSIVTEEELKRLYQAMNTSVSVYEKESEAADLEVLFADDKRVFIDTNILLEDCFYEFWERLEPVITKHRNVNVSRIPVIPYRVIEELVKMGNGVQDERGKKAAKVVRFLREKCDKQLIKVMGDTQSDNFADNVFKTVFTQYRLKYKMRLITNDKGLTEDILQLNNSKADRAFRVKVFKLTKDAKLVNAEGDQSSKRPDYKYPFESEKPLFELKKTPISRVDSPIKVISFPKEGDTIYTNRGTMKLVSTVSETGGEGMVYKTDKGDICKIYHPAKLTLNRKEKIELMIKNKISCEGVCWPTELVYNEYKEFVGYLMPEAKGIELEKLLKVKPILLQTFPNWNKKDTTQLSITILEKIVYLHHHNIILGDINARNILVVSPTEVYFVDCDSYQINKYPCEVGWPHFTAPELIGKDMSKYMRTLGNENFAIATLLFMIMIPGKPPYAQTGSGTPEADIAKMVFAYPKGGEKKGVVAPGQWRFCWSHLSYDMKEAFYNTFQGGEVYSKEEDRLGSKDWLEKMKRYHYVLDKLIENDEQSGWLFPNDYKKMKGVTYENCKCCGKSIKEEDLTEGYCKSCLHEGEPYSCSRCGKELVYSNFQKFVKKKPKYTECYDCMQELETVVKEIECKACGGSFDYTLKQKEFYESKGYEEPKRCQSCRDNNIPIKNEYRNSNSGGRNKVNDEYKVNKSVLDAIKGIWAKAK